MSKWYGTSKFGTFGSKNLFNSTFWLSSFPIGTVGSIIFGITIIIFFNSSESFVSSLSNSFSARLMSCTCFLVSFASSTFFSRINLPISPLSKFLFARNSSPFCFTSLIFTSSSIAWSTRGTLRSWNFFLIFSFTSSGLFLKNLISNIFFSFFV